MTAKKSRYTYMSETEYTECKDKAEAVKEAKFYAEELSENHYVLMVIGKASPSNVATYKDI